MIGLDEPEPWSINSTTGFIYEKTHGSDAFFKLMFQMDPMNTSNYLPSVSDVQHIFIIQLLMLAACT